jgi:hypothetical protein
MILLFTLVILAAAQVNAKLFCAALFSENKFYVTQVMDKKIPAAEVDIGNKNILVMLANSRTTAEIKELYSHSLGIVVNHQKGYTNDHGMLRLGDYFIDRDTPGARRDGEINTTGISWSPVKNYVDYAARAGKGNNRIEVLFDLNPKEMRTALVYQKMRRAGIIRPDFTFKGAKNPELNNRLEECGEICFSFSTGSGVEQQIRAVEKKIQQLGIENPREFINEPDVAAYLNKMSDYLMSARLDGRSLSPHVTTTLTKFSFLDFFSRNRVKKPDALRDLHEIDINWLVGYKASLEYSALLKTLGISNSNNFSNVNAPRASAVLVYDAKTSPEQFLNSDYTSEGVFSTWRNNEIIPLQDAL